MTFAHLRKKRSKKNAIINYFLKFSDYFHHSINLADICFNFFINAIFQIIYTSFFVRSLLHLLLFKSFHLFIELFFFIYIHLHKRKVYQRTTSNGHQIQHAYEWGRRAYRSKHYVENNKGGDSSSKCWFHSWMECLFK